MDDLIESVKKFEFGELFFQISFEKDVNLPTLWLKTLRGGLGLSLRYISCINKNKKCNECQFKEKCIYYNFFEPINFKKEKYKKMKDIPRPFNIQKVTKKSFAKKGEIVEFKINVFGPFIEPYIFIILAIKRLSQFGLFLPRVKFKLHYVYTTLGNKKVPLFEKEKIYERDIRKHLNIRKIKREMLNIKFITPVQLNVNRKNLFIINDINVLLNSILRRYRLILYFWYGNELKMENFNLDKNKYKLYIENYDYLEIKRRSLRTKRKMIFYGISGNLILTSKKLNDIYPILKLSEILNAGKYATMGMGQIKIGG